MTELPDLTPVFVLSLVEQRKRLRREYADAFRKKESDLMDIQRKIRMIEETLEDAGFDYDTGLPR